MLIETMAGEIVEQDSDGLIFVNGKPAPCEPLLAFGTPDLGEEHALVLGHPAAFVVGPPTGGESLMHVATTAPVLWIVAEPDLLYPIGVTGWMAGARRDIVVPPQAS